MFFEFQLSADVLGPLIRNVIHLLDLGINQTFDIFGQSFMVDHIVVQTTTSLQRADGYFSIQAGGTSHVVSGKKAVIVQPLSLAIVSVSDLENNGPAPSSPFQTPEIRILVDVTALASGDSAELLFSFNTIDFGPLVGEVLTDTQKQQIIATIQDNFPTISRTIASDDIRNMLPGAIIQIANAGVIATSDGAVLILRLEIGEGHLESWIKFYNRYDRNLLGGRDWALLIDKDLLIPNIRTTLRDMLADAADRFALESDIDVTWKPQLEPRFDVTFSGEVIDACSCLLVDIDVNVDVTCSLVFQAPGNDKLRMCITADYDASNLEVFCCALTTAIFFPVFNIVFLAKGKMNFGLFTLSLLTGSIGTFIGACIIAGNQSMADLMAMDGNCTKVDDKTVHCDQTFTLQMGSLGGTYHLTAAFAETEGPVFSGTMDSIHELHDPVLSIDKMSQFQWGIGGSCHTGFREGLTGWVSYTNAKIVDVTVLEDPCNVFNHINFDRCFITIHSSLNAEYATAPYPCKLLIVSNGGIRIITLDPANEPTAKEADDLRQKALQARAACYLAVTPVSESIGKYRWLPPDPPPDCEVAQIWQVVISELGAKDKVELLGDRNDVLAIALPSEQRIAQASLWAEGGAVRKQLDVRLTVEAAEAAAPRSTNVIKRHVALRQIQLLERCRIPVKDFFQSLSFKRRNGRPTLNIYAGGMVAAYDLQLPTAPARILSDGMRGEWFVGNQLTAVRQEQTLSISNEVGKVLSEIKLTDDMSITSIANRLYVASPKNVSMISLTGKAEQVPLSGLSVSQGSRIGPARVLGVSQAIAIAESRERVHIYDVSDPKHARELAHYAHEPWFFNAERVGNILAKLSSDGKEVRVYEVDKVVDI